MRKVLLVMIAIIIFAVGLFSFRFLIGGDEDDWIKDSKGVWIKHGNPSSTPEKVIQQQNAIIQARELYRTKKAEGINFSSECLGNSGDYAIDIVNVPRNAEDNLAENQCADYLSGEVHSFIELDKEGNVVRIVD